MSPATTRTDHRVIVTSAALLCLFAASACKQGSRPDDTRAAPAAGTAASGPLLDPGQATATAPAEYTVKLDTTKGEILIDVHREWASLGADRFYNLVRAGYYDNV